MKTRIATTKSSSYVDTKALAGITYYYWIKAVDTTGNKSNYSEGTYNKIQSHATTNSPSILLLPLCSAGTVIPGDFVNIHAELALTPCVRQAIANAPGYEAHGFILEEAIDNMVTVFMSGCVNTKMHGETGTPSTGGYFYLSDTVPGAVMVNPPTTEGYIIQKLGIPATTIGIPMSLLFLFHEPVIIKATS